MIVAIDGPAGSGKSTVARAIAQRQGLCYLDTGAMYRSVTWAALDAHTNLEDVSALAQLATSIDIRFGQETSTDGSFSQRVFVNGTDVTAAIRTPEVDRAVSVVSAVPAVRKAMVSQQRRVAEKSSLVAEGRDIGTTVFPHAQVKVFLTADPEARAHRRAVERAGGNAAKQDQTTDTAAEQQILADLKRRDQLDSTREVAPLKPAKDAVHIDSSHLTVDEVCAKIEALIARAQEQEKPGASSNGPSNSTKSEPKRPQSQTKAQTPKRASRMKDWGNTAADYYEHPVREFPLFTRFCLKTVAVLAWVFTKIVHRWTFEDAAKLKEATKDGRGVVIIMNHQATLDPIVMGAWLILHGISVRAIYKSEFDSHRIMHKLLGWAGGIPVKRGEADIKAVRRAARALKAGECVLIYPEGTRVRSETQKVEIHGGFALIAQMGGAEVLPAAIVGARQIKPKGARLYRPVTVHLKAGDPISFADLGASGRKAQLEAMEQLAVKRMYQLRDELRQSWPGKE